MEDRNKFNLRLSSLSIQKNESTKSKSKGRTNTTSIGTNNHASDDSNNTNDNEDTDHGLVSILPSYHMYQSTISKNLTPTREDRRSNPPSYELAPQSSNNSSVVDYFEGISLPTSPELTPTNPAFNMGSNNTSVEGTNGDDHDENWTNTIVENAHKLKRLTSTNKEISKSLLIETVLTESIGKVGKKPQKINPLSCEFKQGDYIYGYVLVTNKTKEDIPFDMFSVILEGCAIFNSNRNNVVSQNSHVVRFLTMFDFNASWNDASLDRLITDHNNPYIPYNDIDPVDNTYVQLNERKIFQPNVTYKKFFTFKLPEKLLDCTCCHGLVKHLQLPPTLGVSRYEIITNLRQKWKNKGDESPSTLDNDPSIFKFASLTNDFAPTDSSISYSVSARVIGKASDYKSLCKQQIPSASEDEYVVANEDYCYIRVIPSTTSIFELNRSMIDEQARLLYTNMKHRIEEKIDLGKQFSAIPIEDRLASPTPPPLQPTASALEISKMEQSYYSKIRKSNESQKDGFVEVFLPHRKKQVFGQSKVIGLIAFSTRKIPYRADYNALSKYNNTSTHSTSLGSTISIPLDITYVPTANSTASLPEFKKITVDLMILTVKSKRLPIPLVFLPEMLFENSLKESDNFDVITIKKFQKYATELSKLLKEFGESLQVEKDLIYDLKCLANLSCKYDILKIKTVSYSPTESNDSFQLLSSIPWQQDSVNSSSESNSRHFKKFNLNVNIADAIPPASNAGDFCLIPDFQFCCLSRLYYLKINLKTQANEKISLHVPLVLQRSNPDSK